MEDVKKTTYNLNSHYVKKKTPVSPEVCVAVPPKEIKSKHVYDVKEVEKELNIINRDIYNKKENKKQQSQVSFWKFLVISAASILAILGIKKML